jgi:hypothetical protein
MPGTANNTVMRTNSMAVLDDKKGWGPTTLSASV